MTLVFPPCLALRGEWVWDNPGAFVTGGQSVFGGEPLVRRTDGGGGWRAKAQGIVLKDGDEQRTWESLLVRWNLGDNKIIVPRQGHRLRATFVATATVLSTFDDGAPFDDGSLWETGAGICILDADIALRSTTAVINLPVGGSLSGGEPFTLSGDTYGPRLYVVASVDNVSSAGSPDTGDVVTVTFGPPAREAYTAGDAVDFGVPRCTMRAMIDQSDGAYPVYGRSRFATANMTFMETWV